MYFYHFGRGIWLANSNYNNLFNNTTNYNERYGVYIGGNHNNITLLTANYNGVSYSDDGGAFNGEFGHTHHNNYLNCTFKGNKDTGIYIITNAHHIRIIDCKFLNNKEGVHINGITYGSNYHTISNNTFSENIIGITLRGRSGGSNYNTISYNLFELQNAYAISLWEVANYNDFFGNYFFGKKIQFFGTFISNWNNSQIGNYWDDYEGVDQNDDGIGDEPYILSQGVDYLPIWGDGLNFTIIKPLKNKLYSDPPEISIKTNPSTLDKMWYTLNCSPMKHFFSQNGTINASTWLNCTDGMVLLEFFVNDIFGHITSKNITINKDTTDPVITIIYPKQGAKANRTAPSFKIKINEKYLETIWYSVDNGKNNVTCSKIGTINQTLWNAVWDSLTQNDEIFINFYAIDIVGNLGYAHVILIKNDINDGNDDNDNEDNDKNKGEQIISGYELLILLGVISIGTIYKLRKLYVKNDTTHSI